MAIDALSPGTFHGTVSSSRQIRGFTLVETQYRAKQQIASHSHERAYFCFVVRGAFVDTSDGHGRSHTCQPSTLLFHPAGERHADSFLGENGICFNIEVDQHDVEARYDDVHFPEDPVAYRKEQVNWLARQLHAEFRRGALACPLTIEGFALAVLGASLRAPLSTADVCPLWHKSVVDLLRSRFRENLDLATIASEVEIHPVHLARVFRRYEGCTVGAYVLNLRLEFASRRLLASDEALSAIAYAAGFSDQSHFSRSFKRHTGMSPSTYRKLNT